ncbi:MAG: hypothetical protein V1797_09040 [Pseudomonadota bacterium]
MRSFRRLLGRPGLQWLLFSLALVLLHWPYLTSGDWYSETSFVFYFAVWGFLVLALVFLGQGRARPGRGEPPGGDRR